MEDRRLKRAVLNLRESVERFGEEEAVPREITMGVVGQIQDLISKAQKALEFAKKLDTAVEFNREIKPEFIAGIEHGIARAQTLINYTKEDIDTMRKRLGWEK